MLTLTWDNPVLPGFFVFEGLDGAGTTTQAKRLVTAFIDTGRPCEFTCEPTTMITGRTIREALSGAEGVDPWTLALMFAADRHEHLERPRTGIRALLAGDVRVVSDRYLFSSLAYQGALVDFSRVERINHAFPLPEHLIFIDTPRSETERRMAARPTRDRMETTEVQSLVSERYRAIIESFADNSKTRVHMIDGRGSEAEVARRVWHSVRPTG